MARKFQLPSGQTIFLYPRDKLRCRRPMRTLTIPSHLKGVMQSSPLPTPPFSDDYSKNRAVSFPMDGNDNYGDCFYAASCHGSNAFTASVGTEDTFDTQAIIQYYLKLAGGDNGLSADQMFGEWKKGLCGTSHTILDMLSINPTDLAAMAMGIHLYQGALFTLGIPDEWLNSANPGVTWDSGSGVSANDANGHAVYLSGRLPYKVETWGFDKAINLTPAGVAVCDPEAFVVFSLDQFNALGVDVNGYTYDQRAAWHAQLGGKILPPWPGTVPPMPPPVPPPVPVPPVPNLSVLFKMRVNRKIAKGSNMPSFQVPVDIVPGDYAWASVLLKQENVPDILAYEEELK